MITRMVHSSRSTEMVEIQLGSSHAAVSPSVMMHRSQGGQVLRHENVRHPYILVLKSSSKHNVTVASGGTICATQYHNGRQL
jgi:hypothetical protein